MEYKETKRGPVVQVQLRHPTYLPVYKKVHNFAHHPKDGPPMVLLSGGSGARTLSQSLIRYTHNSTHLLPMFDDGGSSHECREAFQMAPPGDLRNRLMAISDMTRSGNPEVSRLFRTRLPRDATPAELQQLLDAFLQESHPQMARIEHRYRRIIIKKLELFNAAKPKDFDLRGGSIGNFVMVGSYLTLGDLESVVFEFSALAAARGEVLPVCAGGNLHLQAELEDGSTLIGQSRITNQVHAPIKRLAIVARGEDGSHEEVRPQLNALAETAIHKAALVAYTMGSFYTSLVSNLMIQGVGRAVRQTKRPKVFVANLTRSMETAGMSVSTMLNELLRYLRASDDQPGELEDYVHYVLVGTHGDSDEGGRIPVDLPAIHDLGVEPIVLPLEQRTEDGTLVHEAEMVAAVLISLC